MRIKAFLALCADSELGTALETLMAKVVRNLAKVIVSPKVIVVEHKMNPQQSAQMAWLQWQSWCQGNGSVTS